MVLEQEPSLFASRATSLIVAACRSAHRPVVLLPALYCADVATAIEESGLQYRCYDVPSSLSSMSSMIDKSYGRDIGVVIALHPFGLSRPPCDLALHAETLLIEDACHALRTSVGTPALGSLGHLTIYSPRKEFGWSEGGAAFGPLVSVLKDAVSPASRVARRWREQDMMALACAGQRMTRLAADALADKLPQIAEGEVLSVLPLKSARRDATIARLRARGVAAWRWLRPLKHTGQGRTPQTWQLRQKLFLVPLFSEMETGRLLEMLSREPLETWDQG